MYTTPIQMDLSYLRWDSNGWSAPAWCTMAVGECSAMLRDRANAVCSGQSISSWESESFTLAIPLPRGVKIAE